MNLQSFLDWCNGHLSDPSQIGILFLAGSYVALVIGVRWQMIARPMRNGIETRLKLLVVDAQNADEKYPQRLIALDIANKALAECKRWSPLEIAFWSRGKETSLWQRIDKAESYLVYAWPVDKLVVRLVALNARLEKIPANPEVKQIRARITDRIARFDTDNPVTKAPSLSELTELYREAVRVERASLVAEDVESDYFNNKILWNILIALAAIVFIANIAPVLSTSILLPPGSILSVHGNEEQFRHTYILLLLAGAVGGILSRLTNALRVGLSASERGTSWMAMFMSPLVGALAGWAGCILLIAAHQLHLILPDVQGTQLGALLASAAVLFGFSERLFIGIADTIEGNVLAGHADKNPVPAEAPVK